MTLFAFNNGGSNEGNVSTIRNITYTLELSVSFEPTSGVRNQTRWPTQGHVHPSKSCIIQPYRCQERYYLYFPSQIHRDLSQNEAGCGELVVAIIFS